MIYIVEMLFSEEEDFLWSFLKILMITGVVVKCN